MDRQLGAWLLSPSEESGDRQGGGDNGLSCQVQLLTGAETKADIIHQVVVLEESRAGFA